jgi:hypothetical protein
MLCWPCRGAKEEHDEEEVGHLDFDLSDEADVDKKEKISTYTKDLTFETVCFLCQWFYCFSF